MPRPRANAPAKFGAFDNLPPQQQEALRHCPNPDFDTRLAAFQQRQVYPERGLDLNDIPLPALRQTAVSRGWMQLIGQPGSYDPLLVREFYAAMIPPIFNRHSTVVVRGITVRLSVDDICQYYHVPRPEGGVDISTGIAPIPRVASHELYSGRIASSLRRNRQSRWEITNAEIRKSELHYDLAMWMLFLKHSLMPSSHHTYADPQVARVLFCIQHNLPLDIGHIIHLAILDAGGKQEMRVLPFPSLITHFCRQFGVPDIGAEDPEPPIGKRAFVRFRNAAVALDGGEAAAHMPIPAGDDDVDMAHQQPPTGAAYDLPTDDVDRSDWPPYMLALRQELLLSNASFRQEMRQSHASLRHEMRQNFDNLTLLVMGDRQTPATTTEAGTSSQQPSRRVRVRPSDPSSSQPSTSQAPSARPRRNTRNN